MHVPTLCGLMWSSFCQNQKSCNATTFFEYFALSWSYVVCVKQKLCNFLAFRFHILYLCNRKVIVF